MSNNVKYILIAVAAAIIGYVAYKHWKKTQAHKK